MIFTSNIHPLYQFRLVLPLHKNHPIDLQSKSIGWFLYSGNTANPRHYLFRILSLTWLKTFFITFPRIITKLCTSPIYWKTITSIQSVITHQDTFLNTVEFLNIINFYPESAALFLDNKSFYHTSIPFLSILIYSKQLLKPKI